MSGNRSISLTRRALQPGADLTHDHYHTVPVDALHALGRCKSELGTAILIAKFGEADVVRLRVATLQMVMEEFTKRGWEVEERPGITVAQTLMMFTDHVVGEFIGEHCRFCKGRGFHGLIYGKVWHRMHKCQPCKGKGVVDVVSAITREFGTKVKGKTPTVRKVCPDCRGKGLTNVIHENKSQRLHPCTKCRGTGRKLGSTRARGRAIRYDQSRIVRVWGERFDEILRCLRDHAKAAITGTDFDLVSDALPGE